MTAKTIHGMSARFLRPEDKQAVSRVEAAAHSGAVHIVTDKDASARIRSLHERAREIDATGVRIEGVPQR